MRLKGLYKKLKSLRAFPLIVGLSLGILSNVIVVYWNIYHSPIENNLRDSSRLHSVLYEDDRIWFVTATQHSFSQVPRLVRIAQTLFLVRDFVTWIIVQEINIEDEATEKYVPQLEKLLSRFGIPFLILPMKRSIYSLNQINDASTVLARHTALAWILQNARRGVLYLAPENFMYDHRIFQEMRFTKTISTWPVGLGRKYGLSSPVLSQKGEFIGYFDGKDPLGFVPNDMSLNVGGYAFNVDYIRKKVSVGDRWKLTLEHYQSFLSLGLAMSDVQFLADKCTKIYVWRGKTRDHPWPKLSWQESLNGTNIEILLRNTFWHWSENEIYRIGTVKIF